ncbi:MAG: hypothetical protein LBD49_01035 [Oscillospiraceae bacterium]|jgi:hypothetical protein|nr:hypothetical protein [Oscillospiraceae bacterium]
MFEYKIPQFNPAPMRREILEALRDLSYTEQTARYGEYSDGVLVGCALFERDMNIGVTGGLVKYAGRVYALKGRDSVPYRPTDAWTVLKIRFGGEEKTRDFLRYTGNLALDDNTNVLPNEMELGRFKLKQGSRLRTEYTDFRDMETEYDTVNLIGVPYAGIGEPTLSPVIMTHFAKEAYPCASEPLDIAFCTACLAGNGVMSRESIRLYLIRRLKLPDKPLDNAELHGRLADALAEMKGGARRETHRESDGILLL